jgi:hypothetical protein
LEGGPPSFRRDSSCPAVLRYLDHPLVICFAYGTLTLSGGPFQAASATDPMRTGRTPSRPYNPGPEGPVWALPLSLAATQGISFDFSSWGYLDVSVLPVGSVWPMDSASGDEASPSPGFPIRAPPDQRLRAAPRGLSQLVAPFFACPCQGIHRAPFLA